MRTFLIVEGAREELREALHVFIGGDVVDSETPLDGSEYPSFTTLEGIRESVETGPVCIRMASESERLAIIGAFMAAEKNIRTALLNPPRPTVQTPTPSP